VATATAAALVTALAGACAVAAAAPAVAGVTPAQVAAQQRAIGEIQAGHDAQRTAAALDPLHRDARLDAVAQAWSDRMAARADAGAGDGALVHSPAEAEYDYARKMPAGWRSAAENIAYNGGSGSGMHAMWMGSAGHRANIDGAAFDSVGYGVSYDAAGRMWGTVVFGDYFAGPWAGTPSASPSASPTSSPTSSPSSSPSSSPTSSPSSSPVVPTRAVVGADRYATGVALAQVVAPAPTAVVLASGERLVDSVPAAPLAQKLGAPLLLTTGGSLSPEVAAHLRATPSVTRVVLVGGERALTPDVEVALRGLGLQVERVGGADRYATALAVAARPELAGSPAVYVARGTGTLADAVAVGGTAAALGAPVLLAPSTSEGVVPAAVAATKDRRVVVVGGTSAVPDAVATALGADERVQGADRYATAAAVADHAVAAGVGAQRVLVASGDDARLADALVSGGAGSVTLLVRPSGWGTATSSWLTAHGVGEVLAVGGGTPTR